MTAVVMGFAQPRPEAVVRQIVGLQAPSMSMFSPLFRREVLRWVSFFMSPRDLWQGPTSSAMCHEHMGFEKVAFDRRADERGPFHRVPYSDRICSRRDRH